MTRHVSEGEFVGRGLPGFRRSTRPHPRARATFGIVAGLSLVVGSLTLIVTTIRGETTPRSHEPPTMEESDPLSDGQPPPSICPAGPIDALGDIPRPPLVTYTAENDIHVWSVTEHRDIDVTGTTSCQASIPAFRSATQLSFVHRETKEDGETWSVVSLLDLRRAAIERWLELPGPIVAQEWTDDGRLAVYTQQPRGPARVYVHHRDPSRRGWIGACGAARSNATVRWSPRGTSILTASGICTLVTRRGPDIEILGPDATWFDDDRILFRRTEPLGLNDPPEPHWSLVEIPSEQEKRLGFPLSWRMPAIAPGSKRIAWTDGVDLVITTLDIKNARRIHNVARPVWLDADRLMVIDAGSCDNCNERPRIGAGMIIDLRTGERTAISLPRVRTFDVWPG